jgi:hypothetical protein
VQNAFAAVKGCFGLGQVNPWYAIPVSIAVFAAFGGANGADFAIVVAEREGAEVLLQVVARELTVGEAALLGVGSADTTFSGWLVGAVLGGEVGTVRHR